MISKKKASVFGMIVCLAMVITGIVFLSKDTGSNVGYIRFGADFYTEEYAATRAAANNINAQTKDMNTAFGMFFILFGLAGEFLFVGKIDEAKREEQGILQAGRQNASSVAGDVAPVQITEKTDRRYQSSVVDSDMIPQKTAVTEAEKKQSPVSDSKPQSAITSTSDRLTTKTEQKTEQVVLTVAQKQTREEICSLCYEPGQYITFGSYPQNTENKDPIEWKVLERDASANRVLVMSRYALDCKPYGGSTEAVTWESSTVREWLNETFLKEAFSREEQEAILMTKVDNSRAHVLGEYDTDGGNDTEDKIFLLSCAETNKYLKDISLRICTPTPCAVKRGSIASIDNKDGKPKYSACWWWLRSPGRNQFYAARVNYGGALNDYSVNYGFGAVRPAFWLDLSAI